MKAVIDRYGKAKEEQLSVNNATSELMFWQRGAASLRQQLHNLQESHKQLMGEELSGLGARDLQSLENRLEMSLRSVRMRKDHLLKNEIEELHRKGSVIHQENLELCRRVNIMSQQKMELQRKLQASEGVVADANTSFSTPYSFNIAQDADVTCNLERRHSHQKVVEHRETGAPELG
ncbi:hypothetical protein HU200_004035 [Digitaria exilis]|uniref:K-box domain-containing protein n=1 Tax=Digitaria exilis TaxID=1010633 RepID=A0A835FWI1_9POAL|nr:hypothetical protein HU200_004035 [Digitaria exilis]